MLTTINNFIKKSFKIFETFQCLNINSQKGETEHIKYEASFETHNLFRRNGNAKSICYTIVNSIAKTFKTFF